MTTATMPIKKLAPWFGANTGRAELVGELIGRVAQACVPFMGGGCELPHIQCREGIASDLHGAVVNLSRVIRCAQSKADLRARLDSTLFHEQLFRDAQTWCLRHDDARARSRPDAQLDSAFPDVDWAYHYFLACWMGPGGKAGTRDHFGTYFSVRFSESGGGCAKRFRSAVESLDAWHAAVANWVFLNTDAFGILDRLAGRNGKRIERIDASKTIEPCGIYNDPPWPDLGRDYSHASAVDQERAFHTDLERRLRELVTYRVVVRYGVHPLIDELYAGWSRLELDSSNQANNRVPEVLLTNEPFRREVPA